MLAQKAGVAVVTTTTPNDKNVSVMNNTTRQATKSSAKSTRDEKWVWILSPGVNSGGAFRTYDHRVLALQDLSAVEKLQFG